MTLTTLLTYIAFAAIALTFVIALYKKGHKSWFMTFLQNFTGILFLVSGWVKAVDPMGTAFKMEQYFAEFESTFEATWFSFMAPVFPLLSKFAIAFSVLMIIYEMILGIMLILAGRISLTNVVAAARNIGDAVEGDSPAPPERPIQPLQKPEGAPGPAGR